jgi:hypothetical protein
MLALSPVLGPLLGLTLGVLTFACPSVVNSLLSPFGLSLNTQIPIPLALVIFF